MRWAPPSYKLQQRGVIDLCRDAAASTAPAPPCTLHTRRLQRGAPPAGGQWGDAFVIDIMTIELNYQHTQGRGRDIFLIGWNKEAVTQEHDR